ncbi:MAG: lysophospholipid acyltransferase family protein [Opitutaceae bacterium]|nr:lysophospholipid acyltransferase family protein [Opitutaceae bacterium]
MSGFHQVDMEPLYGVSSYLFESIYHMLFGGEVHGLANLPKGGGYMIASNHASHLDPPVVGCMLPTQVSFFARKTLWKKGLASWWLDGVGTIPVDRDGGSDVTAIKRVLSSLKAKKVIILFPEGTRSLDGRLQTPKPGVGLLACRTGVPVVPARVFGSFEAFGRSGRLRFGSPIHVVYGKPMQASEYDNPADGKDRYQRASERIMGHIAAIELPRVTVI